MTTFSRVYHFFKTNNLINIFSVKVIFDMNFDWQDVQTTLKQKIGNTAFETWVKPISFGAVKSGLLTLFVPTKFMQEWVENHYLDAIKTSLTLHNPEVTDINLKVRPLASNKKQEGLVTTNNLSTPVASPAPKKLDFSSSQVSLEGNSADSYDLFNYYLDTRFTFDEFIVGSSNEFAAAAALKVAENKDVSFNPLYIYSGVGHGKTHLMHAIAWKIKELTPKRKVVYLSAEKFMYNFINAIRFNDTFSFKEKFRSIDVLMIDDIQFLTNKGSTQAEFCNTFNALVDQGKQLILSADTAPQNLQGIEERLKTRMCSGLVADIAPTSYDLRAGILQKKADSLQASIPEDVIDFLANKITTNVRELEGALKKVVAYSQLVGGDINLERTKNVLKDTLIAYDRKVTIDEIQRKVSEHFKIKVSEMQSKRREREVARPRQIAMYLAKKLTTRSLPEIGRKFDRDHTTVIHAVKTIEDLSKTNHIIAEDVSLLCKMLGQ